jgi:hypothetical protein
MNGGAMCQNEIAKVRKGIFAYRGHVAPDRAVEPPQRMPIAAQQKKVNGAKDHVGVRLTGTGVCAKRIQVVVAANALGDPRVNLASRAFRVGGEKFPIVGLAHLAARSPLVKPIPIVPD